MAAIIKGTGVVWSVGAIVFTAGIVSGTNAAYTQSARMARTSEKTEVKDNGGVIKAVAFHGFKKTLSLTVVPAHATTLAGAVTSLDAWNPPPGTLVTLTDDQGTLLDDNYNVISSSQSRTVDGVVTVDLELEAGDEGTEIATAPIT